VNSLAWRVVSALVAATILVGSQILFKEFGLFCISTLVVAVALVEYKNIGFLRVKTPPSFQYMFLALSIALYGLIVSYSQYQMLSLTVTLAAFYSLGLWLAQEKTANVKLLTSFGIGTLGFIYCVAFPALATKMLITEGVGVAWFSALLVVVFAGDTGAYFGGKFLGKRKLMPSVSPKKTVEGAFFGALSSGIIGGAHFYFFIPNVNPLGAGLFCVCTGLVAQCGDLIISLVKRVADVKDSGKIMPGHGGFLDRLDGVFIAAPLVHAFAVFTTRLPL